MTVEALLLEWIPDGGLPIYGLQAGQHYWQFRQDRTWDIIPASRRGQMWVSLELDLLGVDFEPAFRELLEPVITANEAGALFLVLRTCCELDDQRFLLGGLAFVPRADVRATPLEGADPAVLLAQFCNGIAATNSATLHPALRAAFDRELAHRAETEHQRQQDATALARSLELLESHLRPDQLSEFHETGAFHVRLRDGRLFRFTKRFGHNVHLVENGDCVTEYCIIAVERIPLYDQMLAQKVLLEALPEEFFRLANFRNIQPSPAPTPPPFAELVNVLAQE